MLIPQIAQKFAQRFVRKFTQKFLEKFALRIIQEFVQTMTESQSRRYHQKMSSIVPADQILKYLARLTVLIQFTTLKLRYLLKFQIDQQFDFVR